MKKQIPNLITLCNLLCGTIAAYYAVWGKLDIAAFFIMLGIVFDFFDGLVARLLGVSSPLGKELDSLADVVTSGVAPGLMLLHIFWSEGWGYFSLVALLVPLFSAYRLAKFNLDERQTTSFIGLPTPANALFWGSLIVGAGERIATIPHAYVFILILIAVTCWLLVAEIPMFALKFKQWGWKGNEVRYLFILSCIPILLIFGISGFALIIAWYVILSAFTQKS